MTLTFWKDNLTKINGVPFWPVQTVPTKIVYSDACYIGVEGLHNAPILLVKVRT